MESNSMVGRGELVNEWGSEWESEWVIQWELQNSKKWFFFRIWRNFKAGDWPHHHQPISQDPKIQYEKFHFLGFSLVSFIVIIPHYPSLLRTPSYQTYFFFPQKRKRTRSKPSNSVRSPVYKTNTSTFPFKVGNCVLLVGRGNWLEPMIWKKVEEYLRLFET